MISAYFQQAFRNLPQTVDNLCAHIEKSGVKFDAIAVRGVSGMLVGPTVSLRLYKPLIIVRKEKERDYSHAHYLVECDNMEIGEPRSEYVRFIFIDDLISSGESYRSVCAAIKEEWTQNKLFGQNEPQCVCAFCYAPQTYTPRDWQRRENEDAVRTRVIFADKPVETISENEG